MSLNAPGIQVSETYDQGQKTLRMIDLVVVREAELSWQVPGMTRFVVDPICTNINDVKPAPTPAKLP